jgi:CRISPR/Cas system-associated protein Cas5 (RAMP superfamily)
MIVDKNKNIKDKNIKTIIKTSFDYTIPKEDKTINTNNSNNDEDLNSLYDVFYENIASKYTLQELVSKLKGAESACYYTLPEKILVGEGVLLKIINNVIEDNYIPLHFLDEIHKNKIKDILYTKYGITWHVNESIEIYLNVLKEIKLNNRYDAYGYGFNNYD